MKADFQKISSKSLENSFVDFWVCAKVFGFHWHYHPEIEICYVRQGRVNVSSGKVLRILSPAIWFWLGPMCHTHGLPTNNSIHQTRTWKFL